MNAPTHAPWLHSLKAFKVGNFPLEQVVSITSNGAVLAHVNCNFGNGLEIAARITTAVNAHDELMAALQNLLDSCQGSKVGFWTIPSDAAINAARAALTKVQP